MPEQPVAWFHAGVTSLASALVTGRQAFLLREQAHLQLPLRQRLRHSQPQSQSLSFDARAGVMSQRLAEA